MRQLATAASSALKSQPEKAWPGRYAQCGSDTKSVSANNIGGWRGLADLTKAINMTMAANLHGGVLKIFTSISESGNDGLWPSNEMTLSKASIIDSAMRR